jgi:hypothetical protein
MAQSNSDLPLITPGAPSDDGPLPSDPYPHLEHISLDPLRRNAYLEDMPEEERARLAQELANGTKLEEEAAAAAVTEKKHEFAQEMVDFNQRFQE